MFKEGDIVRHLKTQGLYEILHYAYLEYNLEKVVVYRSLAGKSIWVRPQAEMEDGRFELVAEGQDH